MKVRPRTLRLWIDGAPVGTWSLKSGRHVLEYESSWLGAPRASPISLSLPLLPAGSTHRDSPVEAFFENLIPENDGVRQRLRDKYGAGSTSAFDLLACVGTDVVGALQILPEDQAPRTQEPVGSPPMTPAQVADHLRRIESRTATNPGEEDDLRLSIAGAHAKTALLLQGGRWHRPEGATPSTHILKLPLGFVGSLQVDLRESVENEWLCGRVLGQLGFHVARSEMKSFEEVRALVVERFDRVIEPGGVRRLLQEDLCQALGTPPDRKYENQGGPGVSHALKLLEGSESAKADRAAFMAAQVVFWMLAATDGHAKNFSIFLGPQGRFRLTPIDDVLSVRPVMGNVRGCIDPRKVRMAMAVWGESRHSEWQEIQRRHFNVTAKHCRLAGGAEPIIRDLIERVPAAVKAVSAELPDDFPDRIATPILDGLVKAAEDLDAMPPA